VSRDEAADEHRRGAAVYLEHHASPAVLHGERDELVRRERGRVQRPAVERPDGLHVLSGHRSLLGAVAIARRLSGRIAVPRREPAKPVPSLGCSRISG
jgi:hypothetical protein